MANVTEEELQHLAHLCRIRCSPEKQASLLRDFRQIIAYIDQLSEVDTTGVEPCQYVTEGHTKLILREDEPENTLSKEWFLKQAPSTIAGLVRVPTVLRSKE